MSEQLKPSQIEVPQNIIRRSPLTKILIVFALIGLWIISVAMTTSIFLKENTFGPLTLIALIADIFGILMGSLGIYYYFRSEELKTVVEEEAMKTTVLVQGIDLKTQILIDKMWDVIRNTLGGNDTNSEQALQAVEHISDQLDKTKPKNESIDLSLEENLKIVKSYIQENEERQHSLEKIAPNFTNFLDDKDLLNLAKLAVQVNIGMSSRSDFVSELNRFVNKGLRFRDLPYLYEKLGFQAFFNEDGTIKDVEFKVKDTS